MEADHAGALSLLAPVVAIGLALVTRKVIPSLATGAVIGALVAAAGDPVAALRGIWTCLSSAVFDLDHLKISLFSVLVAGMVGLLSVSGAMQGMVERIQGLARGRRGAMVASWLSGLVVFFDDYANCLVVGNAMGPLSDRVGVSRAKLSYIVDSTAAPVATLAVVSTWVAFQVDELDKALEKFAAAPTAFELFVASLPYGFYSWATIVFVGAIALTGRDYGPMLRAEESARGAALPDDDLASAPAMGAVLPIATLVGLTFAGLYWTGRQELGPGDYRLFEIIGAARAYDAMLLGSAAAIVLGAVLAIALAGLAPIAVPGAAWTGIKPVLEALAVLYMAWTLGEAIRATGAGDFISGAVGESLAPQLIPVITFVLAGAISFATGTSFGTMTILIPLAIPLAIGADPDTPALASPVVLGATGAVLSGAVLGDHASPISDTTILSALGSGVDLVTHVRTQLPYALTAGTIAVVFGYVPAGFGLSPWAAIGLGGVACVAVVWGIGRVPQPVSTAVPAETAVDTA